MDTTGAKCAVCYAFSNRAPGSCVFVNVDSRLAKEGVCDRHRITEDTRIYFIPEWGLDRKHELERKYPDSLIYYTSNYEKANVKPDVPTRRI